MRFLKTKIAHNLAVMKAQEALKTPQPIKISQKKSPLASPSKVKSPVNMDGKVKKPRKLAVGNNIMKNYCRALLNFNLSQLAEPYLKESEDGKYMTCERFRELLLARKKKMNCIKSLRELLLPEAGDTEEIKFFKRKFQRVCEVFLKYFCVNWIFHSKVADKMKHLAYRGKILRRVQKPEHFTYLESFVKKEK